MARWLIENLYLFQHAENLNCNICFYEDLVRDPVREISDLCKSLDIEVFKDLAEKARKPSVTTHPRSHIRKGDRDVNSWRNALPPESVAQIDHILNSMNFEYPQD